MIFVKTVFVIFEIAFLLGHCAPAGWGFELGLGLPAVHCNQKAGCPQKPGALSYLENNKKTLTLTYMGL